jgi:hypothetical protein
VAGSGQPGTSGDGGPATAAKLAAPTGLAVTSTGIVYIAGTANNKVRKVSSAGVITTYAGTGASGSSGDGGPASLAKLNGPIGLAVDSTGNLFIADTGNNKIREVLTNGTIKTFAGTGQSGFSGNSGPATSAKLNSPLNVAVSGSTVLIADTGNSQVRKVVGGTITAYAGTGSLGYSGDGGQATSAKIALPAGIVLDPLGNGYIVDVGNSRVRQVTASGVISTFAGTGTPGFSGDGGPATLAKILPLCGGVTADAANIFFGDAGNNRVRRVHKGGPPPALPEAPLTSAVLAGTAALVLAGAAVVARRNRKRGNPVGLTA